MIIAILLSFVSWIFLFLFEIIKTKNKNNIKNQFNPFFILGTVLLMVSYLLFGIYSFNKENIMRLELKNRLIIGAILFSLSIFYYVYIIFFSLSKNALTKENNQLVIKTGIYKRHRHPGLIAFILVSISLSIFVGSYDFLLFSLINSIINIIYIILQDIYFFPSYIDGYQKYKTDTFFL